MTQSERSTDDRMRAAERTGDAERARLEAWRGGQLPWADMTARERASVYPTLDDATRRTCWDSMGPSERSDMQSEAKKLAREAEALKRGVSVEQFAEQARRETQERVSAALSQRAEDKAARAKREAAAAPTAAPKRRRRAAPRKPRQCVTGGNCSSFGSGRSCGARDCDGIQ